MMLSDEISLSQRQCAKATGPIITIRQSKGIAKIKGLHTKSLKKVYWLGRKSGEYVRGKI